MQLTLEMERSEEFRAFLKEDLKNFVRYCWYRLGLPSPTPIQLDIADYLQDEDRHALIVAALRGIGKSFITSALPPWYWLRNPDWRVLVTSASSKRAAQFAKAVKSMLYTFPALQYLYPKGEQRKSNLMFDVSGAGVDQQPSLMCLGITSQLTGNRAHLVINDDIETSKNSITQTGREQIREQVKEFTNIVRPIHEGGREVYLGTFQNEESIYTELHEERGYDIRIWPARYVDEETNQKTYWGEITPMLMDIVREKPYLLGRPTEPSRFGEAELIRKEQSVGKATFAMQFMLNPRLSDAERYPLRISDCMVTPVGPKAPLGIVWTSAEDHVAKHVPSVGFSGDVWRMPKNTTPDSYGDFVGAVMAIDPAGRGADETAYAVVKASPAAQLFCTAAGGVEGGYDNVTLEALAKIARLNSVTTIVVESNFGDGMFTTLFKPVLWKFHKCAVEEVRSTTQKEKRIIDTLEPLMMQHRLIFDEAVVLRDRSDAKKSRFQLLYQLTRITAEAGCLAKDDRLDALAMACAKWQTLLGQDVNAAAIRSIEDALRKEMEAWDRSIGVLVPQKNQWRDTRNAL